MRNTTPRPVARLTGNWTQSKTVLTDAAGKVELERPHDRAGTFEPAIVAKRHAA